MLGEDSYVAWVLKPDCWLSKDVRSGLLFTFMGLTGDWECTGIAMSRFIKNEDLSSAVEIPHEV